MMGTKECLYHRIIIFRLFTSGHDAMALFIDLNKLNQSFLNILKEGSYATVGMPLTPLLVQFVYVTLLLLLFVFVYL